MSDDVDDKVIDIVTRLIVMQLGLVGSEGDPLRGEDEFARGYVLGFCDAATQLANIQDESRCLGICGAVLLEVFGEEKGEALGKALFAEMGKGRSLGGQSLGGAEFAGWLRAHQAAQASGADEPPPPTGLYAYIVEGRSGREEA